MADERVELALDHRGRRGIDISRAPSRPIISIGSCSSPTPATIWSSSRRSRSLGAMLAIRAYLIVGCQVNARRRPIHFPRLTGRDPQRAVDTYVEGGGERVSFARIVPSFTPGWASSTTSSTVTYRPSPRSMLSSLVTGSPGRE